MASSQHDSERNDLMFDPPVYKQRYNLVMQMIKQLCPKKARVSLIEMYKRRFTNR